MTVNIQKGYHSFSTENALFIYSWFRGGHEIETFGTVHLTKRQTYFFKQHLINPIKIGGLKFLGSSSISDWGSQFEVLQVSCTSGGLNQTLFEVCIFVNFHHHPNWFVLMVDKDFLSVFRHNQV